MTDRDPFAALFGDPIDRLMPMDSGGKDSLPLLIALSDPIGGTTFPASLFEPRGPVIINDRDVDNLYRPLPKIDFDLDIEETPKRQSFRRQGGLEELNRRNKQRQNAVADMREAALARKAKRRTR